MIPLAGKNIFIAIPKSQFCEEELYPLRDLLMQSGARVVVLSKSGQAARGMDKTSFQPDGTIVDWNKQPGIMGKYHAVVVLGGKGARKSLWEDPILPQILTDHFRAGRVTAAVGQGVAVLVQAGLTDAAEIPPEEAGPSSTGGVSVSGTVVTATGKQNIPEFAETLLRLLSEF